MLDVKRLIQITLFVLAIVSSSLLGMGLGSSRLVVIAFVGATLGFVITDLLRLFRIDGVLANIASVVILFLAMKDFFSEDSTGKLVSVANLLVYLQTVLMFQEKTPRLNWQILVLSLLQVVVGTIFSLDLEAGMLFLFYFLVAGTAMLLQAIYTETVDVERRNRRVAGRMMRDSEISAGDSPLMFFDPGDAPRSHLGGMICHLMLWISVATAFTSVMFYLVPRHARPWFGPTIIEASSAGASKSVDLDERGVIEMSNQLMFRVSFTDVASGKPFDITGNPPYFRGLALSSLVIENNKTNWRAPHDRVHRGLYQGLPTYRSRGVPVYQTISLEETTDPLVYGVMPFFQANDTPEELSFCHEVSALTRSNASQRMNAAPYKYTAGTIVDEQGRFCRAWPYLSNSVTRQSPMYDDQPQHEWLTQMDPSRYPSLVGISDQIASENEAAGGDRLSLLRKFESYFLKPGQFRYTVDFRTVKRDEKLDPVEDFVRNHRSGHCELFASALTLMLRRQNIPARLVVGFHGADYNQLTGSYLVRAKNAHAWVEAYLGPEDCPPEMVERGEAGRGGAWVILESTPVAIGAADGSMRDGALDLARTVWDDYVLGMEGESQESRSAISLSMFNFLAYLDLENWESEFRNKTKFVRGRNFKYVVMGLLGLLMFAIWMRAVRKVHQPSREANRKIGRLRRLVAGALSLIAPGLGAWMMEGRNANRPTAFYQRMIDLLESSELHREPSQTHREFATEVAGHFQSHPAANLIQSTVKEVTELFNEVRFGRVELDEELCEQIELSLMELKDALKVS